MDFRVRSGYTALEILIALAIVSILAALAVRPATSLLHRLKMRTAMDNIKHFIISARSRAMANPMTHCVVVFTANPAPKPDSVWAFLDKSNPPNGTYQPAVDQRYLWTCVLKKKDSIAIASMNTGSLVFRGDGSAHTSAQIVFRSRQMIDTLDVLASTGRVKVKLK